MVCNSGVGLTPVIDGRVHWFGVCGIANGLAVMTDEETWSLWDHITGESFEGPSMGQRLDVWPLSLTTARAAFDKDPAIVVLRPHHRSVFRRFTRRVPWYRVNQRRFFPPSFRRSMSQKIDPRLPRFTQGLGVISEHTGKFYPMDAIPRGGAIEDQWRGQRLWVERALSDGLPFARWNDSTDPPMQLLSRWYGFSFTYPDCEIYIAPTG